MGDNERRVDGRGGGDVVLCFVKVSTYIRNSDPNQLPYRFTINVTRAGY